MSVLTEQESVLLFIKEIFYYKTITSENDGILFYILIAVGKYIYLQRSEMNTYMYNITNNKSNHQYANSHVIDI